MRRSYVPGGMSGTRSVRRAAGCRGYRWHRVYNYGRGGGGATCGMLTGRNCKGKTQRNRYEGY